MVWPTQRGIVLVRMRKGAVINDALTKFTLLHLKQQLVTGRKGTRSRAECLVDQGMELADSPWSLTLCSNRTLRPDRSALLSNLPPHTRRFRAGAASICCPPRARRGMRSGMKEDVARPGSGHRKRPRGSWCEGSSLHRADEGLGLLATLFGGHCFVSIWLGHICSFPWVLYPQPRNSDGNPDSPQVVVFLATIIDVTVGS